MRRGRHYEIAIVGMSCQFPGATDLSQFFEQIIGANDAARAVPPKRENAEVSLAQHSRANDALSVSRRGYQESPPRFNLAAPRLMTCTATCTGHEDFMALGATSAALADAGLDRDSLKAQKAASFIVDACKGSSFAALYLAIRALQKKRINLAIAGGVILNADGDTGAINRVQSAGLIMLKRKADAELDGDRIYAIIQGMGLARDEKTSQGPAARPTQSYVRALRRAYRSGGVDPATIGLIETSVLGTSGPARAELRALTAVFPPLGEGRRTLAAASSIFGHAMSATGMPGLISGALALYQRALPPSRCGETARGRANDFPSRFALNPAARPWIHGDEGMPRRAGVDAFGVSGINGHLVLEEHAPSSDGDRPGALRTWETEAILLSGSDRGDLVRQIDNLLSWLKSDSQHTLLDLAYSLNSHRPQPHAGVRLGLVATSKAELTERLASVAPRIADPACRSIRDGRGIYFWDEPLLTNGQAGMAFLFPGEGSQYPGMLADLCLHFPEVRALFDTADRIARDLGESVPPSEHLFGPVAAGDEKLWSTATAVNVVLNAQWALYQVLTRLGLRPSAVVGHSSGEILALSAAGVFETDRDLERKLGRLGAIMKDFESSGDLPAARLVAVATHREGVQALCRDLNADDVAIAMDNCPHQVVLAVPSGQLARVTERLRLEKILFEELPFSRAYHTPGFRTVVGPIADFFEQMSFRAPVVPIYSCASGRRMPSSPDAIRKLAIDQWTQTVAFRETIETMQADGLRVFIDVGARGNLAGFVEDTLRGKPSFAMGANLPRRAGVTQLNHLVAATFAHGAAINTDYLYSRRQPGAIAGIASKPATGIATSPKNGFVAGDLPDPHLAAPVFTDLERSDSPLVTPDAEELFEDRFVEPSADDRAMLSFQATMQAFLETQQAVMAAYLGVATTDESSEASAIHVPMPPRRDTFSCGAPGAWTGEICRLVPGTEVETLLILEAHDDPIAHHHTLGGRKISALNPSLLGLPVLPFAVMAEMTAQVASLVVRPGLILSGLNAVRAHKWVRYEDQPVFLELRGHHLSSADDERVWVGIFNRGVDGNAEATRPVFEAIANFRDAVPVPDRAVEWPLENARASKFTAHSVYHEQWLFHGPLFQAIRHVGNLSEKGIEGRLQVLDLDPLVKDGQSTRFHTDLVVIDNFTQLLGAWGLDYLAEGDVMFPLHMEELEIQGARPPVGTEVACQIRITKLERHRITVDAQFLRSDGTVWMRINDWEDWRFHWPGRYRDSFRQPRDYFVGEEQPLETPSQGAPAGAKAVWLEPPADMGRPVWRDVLEFTQLGPEERADFYRAGTLSEAERSQLLWGRIAAKEAARRLWSETGQAAVYPADLTIVANDQSRPLLRPVGEPAFDAMPAIAIAHSEGVAIALAVLDPTARVGVAIAPIVNLSPTFDEKALTSAERAILDRFVAASRTEWLTRFWCAKEAAAKASGLRSAGDPARVQVKNADADTGAIEVLIVPDRPAPYPDGPSENTLSVISARRGDRAWAWTIAKGVEL